MKLYKRNIFNNGLFLIICFYIFTISIFLDSFISSKGSEINISEIQLIYNNLSLFRQGTLYIPICTVITLKLLSFTDNDLYIVRSKSKDKIWNIKIKYILITNFIISLYLVILSYISGTIFSSQAFIDLNTMLTLLLAISVLYTIGLSIFTVIALILNMITSSKNISYIILLLILVPEILNQHDSIILYSISLNIEYIRNIVLIFSSIIKFSGVMILCCEFGRSLYKIKDIYNIKYALTIGKSYEK